MRLFEIILKDTPVLMGNESRKYCGWARSDMKKTKILTFILLALLTACGGDKRQKYIISEYSLNGVVGIVDHGQKSIKIPMPSGTQFTALTASFIAAESKIYINGIEQISGSTVNDFTFPLIYTIITKNGSRSEYTVIAGVEVATWQTYSASEPGGLHRWVDAGGGLTVERLPQVSPMFHYGYAFARNGVLIAADLSSSEEFQYNPVADSFSRVPVSKWQPFVAIGSTFKSSTGELSACPLWGGECNTVAIQSGTRPYVYAENKGVVLVTTNIGEVLVFDGIKWTRCSRSGDVFRPDANEAMLVTPRGVQFYCSIKYLGRTLLGEWPSGRIYEFDGKELRPSNILQPPFVNPVGWEAQSMAEYAGDLFVGYWPHGEVWRRDRHTGKWTMAVRLFSHPDVGLDYSVPYSWRSPDGLPESFYGQRVTALVPVGKSLYAVTANASYWPHGHTSNMLTSEQEAEYGAIYRLTIPGCETIY